MKYILILIFLSGISACARNIRQVKDGGVPLGVPLEGVKYQPLIDPITGEPFYLPFSLTKYAKGHEGETSYPNGPKWIEWDYNADSTERVMRISDYYVPYIKYLLEKRFKKIVMRKKGEVNDSLYLEFEPAKNRIKLPKYDLHLQPEMKEEFMKIAKKNFLKRHPYRIKTDENGREMLITGEASPYVPMDTPEGKLILTQMAYEDTFYLDDIEKYGEIGEPVLAHSVRGEPWDAVDVPLLFKGKIVAVARFLAYGAAALAPRDNLDWDKYPFVNLEEGKELIEKEIMKRYEGEKPLPDIQEIAYFGSGTSPFIYDEKKKVAKWVSPGGFRATAEVCFVAALLSNGEVLFINPMTKEVR
jgi:hypothetical protein